MILYVLYNSERNKNFPPCIDKWNIFILIGQ